MLPLCNTYTGHLSGSNKIFISRNGQEREISIREAYHHWIGEVTESEPGYCKCGCRYRTKVPDKNNARKGEIKGIPLDFIPSHRDRCTPWDLDIPTYTKSYDGHSVVLNLVEEIIQGSQYVYNLRTDHHALKCTPYQEIMTDKGWVCMGDVTRDTKVMIYIKPGVDVDFERLCVGEKPGHIKFMQVNSISSYNSEEPTYVVMCTELLNNFVANGFIVRPYKSNTDQRKRRRKPNSIRRDR
mgnify:FL=1